MADILIPTFEMQIETFVQAFKAGHAALDICTKYDADGQLISLTMNAKDAMTQVSREICCHIQTE